MWAIINNTPFAAERCWVRDKDGAEIWIVAVKGTFDIGPDGATSLAEEQVEVCMAPKFRGEPTAASLLYDTDLNHVKHRTDVVLNGHAYAPKAKPAASVDVRLRVGSIDKTVRVVGDRTWERSFLGVKMSEPAPFLKMPITYERAFGGVDARDPDRPDWEVRNPVGIGFAVSSDAVVGKTVANVEDPRRPIHDWQDRPEPAGLGAIASHWAQRVKFAGTYDEDWQRDRQPLLPSDFDERFYQCAPADQQTEGFLVGDEIVEIENATPNGFLRFRLPKVKLGFFTRFHRGSTLIHRPNLHTVTIEPDVPRVMMTWHTALPCHHQVLKLMTTFIKVKQRIKLGASDLHMRG